MHIVFFTGHLIDQPELHIVRDNILAQWETLETDSELEKP